VSPPLFQGLKISFIQQHLTFRGWRGELQAKALRWFFVVLEQINPRRGSLSVANLRRLIRATRGRGVFIRG